MDIRNLHHRVIVLALGSVFVGCGDAPVAPPEPPVPTTLTVTPSVIEIARLGETMQLIARVLDQHGRGIDAAVTWSSNNAVVASVDTTGLVTAVDNGSATIRAVTGALAASAVVTVDDPVAADYAPDRAALMDFYDGANGPRWPDNSGWGEERVPMGEWYGVTTAFDSAVGRNRVERLHLRENNLRGTRLPTELADLAYLRAVDLLGAVWSETRGRANIPILYRCLGRPSQQGFPLCYPASAYPPGLMDLQRLDSLRLGLDLCVPADNTTLRNWLWSRSHYPYVDDAIPYPYHKATPCLGPDDVDDVRVSVAQAVEAGDTLRAGRDAWVVVRPKKVPRKRRHPSHGTDEQYYFLGNRWPAIRAEVCLAECTTFEMAQHAPPEIVRTRNPGLDTLASMSSSDSRQFVQSEYSGGGGDSWWAQGVAATPVPGDLIQPGVTIAVTMESRTVGDTITIWQREMTPVVLDALPSLEITLVAMVSPNAECADSVMAGAGYTDDCYEWPDSTIHLDLVQGHEEQVLFQQLRHWFPIGEIDYRWHDELLQSKAWDRAYSLRDAAGDDLSRLANMAEEDGRYWIGIGCLVGNRCNLGFGGVSGIARLGGRFSVTVPYGPVLAHELGHNLGLRHPDEIERLSASLDALVVGKWTRPDGDQYWSYVNVPVPPTRPTFMQSSYSNRTARDGEGIAPWQFQHIEGQPASSHHRRGPTIVVVN